MDLKSIQPDPVLEKKLNFAAVIISIILLAVVIWMRGPEPRFDFGVDFGFLPPLHSAMNALTAVVLIAAVRFVRKGQYEMHKRSIYLAMILSVLFLASYVLYHVTTPVTTFEGEGFVKWVYFFFLITHVVLAAVILPFILFTFNRAFSGHFQRHKRMARWVLPIWLYVAITGPICYLMLLPYY
ncbi:MAG: DUF420 domain-containing protein [Saprospirales bacterium]|nr:MAG: DUF420 domain-containing protein [Saprospirales bacterium]